MIKLKDIQTLFSDFCENWNYSIEDYREDIGFLVLKHNVSYSDWIRWIHIDFYDKFVRVYSMYKSHRLLYSDILKFEEMHDLYNAISKVNELIQCDF